MNNLDIVNWILKAYSFVFCSSICLEDFLALIVN